MCYLKNSYIKPCLPKGSTTSVVPSLFELNIRPQNDEYTPDTENQFDLYCLSRILHKTVKKHKKKK